MATLFSFGIDSRQIIIIVLLDSVARKVWCAMWARRAIQTDRIDFIGASQNTQKYVQYLSRHVLFSRIYREKLFVLFLKFCLRNMYMIFPHSRCDAMFAGMLSLLGSGKQWNQWENIWLFQKMHTEHLLDGEGVFIFNSVRCSNTILNEHIFFFFCVWQTFRSVFRVEIIFNENHQVYLSSLSWCCVRIKLKNSVSERWTTDLLCISIIFRFSTIKLGRVDKLFIYYFVRFLHGQRRIAQTANDWKINIFLNFSSSIRA